MDNSVNKCNSIFCSKDAEEEWVTHSRSNNIKCASYNDANEVFNELFEPFCWRYERNLEKPMRETGFIFDSVQLMYYICHVTAIDVLQT